LLLTGGAGGVGSGGGVAASRAPPGNPLWDDTELIEVAVDMTLALPDDLELVVDTDRRVLEAPWYEIFP
jgi:hypothetical protein